MSEPVVACQQNSDLGNLESLMHRAWWSLEAWPFLHAFNTLMLRFSLVWLVRSEADRAVQWWRKDYADPPDSLSIEVFDVMIEPKFVFTT